MTIEEHIRAREEKALAEPVGDVERTRVAMMLLPEMFAVVDQEKRVEFVRELCNPGDEEGPAGVLIGRLLDYACLQRRSAQLLRQELIDLLRDPATWPVES